MEELTIQQLQSAITRMKYNVEIAMEAHDPSLASKFYDKIDLLCIEIHKRLNDPNTTLADVRRFEGV